MKIRCPKCNRSFIPSQYNTHIIGPDVAIECPYTGCDYKYKGKMTSFVRDQIGGALPQSAHCAVRMQTLAQGIELNSSEYYKKKGLRHGGKKKVRNLRD